MKQTSPVTSTVTEVKICQGPTYRRIFWEHIKDVHSFATLELSNLFLPRYDPIDCEMAVFTEAYIAFKYEFKSNVGPKVLSDAGVTGHCGGKNEICERGYKDDKTGVITKLRHSRELYIKDTVGVTHWLQ